MNIVPVQDVRQMAEAVAKSKLFGVKTPEEAMSLMLIAQAEGMHPAMAARDYHIIQGRPALKADTMLARFQAAGGSVEWTEYTEKRVSGKFSHPQGGSVEIAWTFDMAKGIGLTNKDNWKNYPRAMLRARCISEGIRAVFPGVAVGTYTVEEAQDMPPLKEVEGETLLSQEQIETLGKAIDEAEDGAAADAAWKAAAQAARAANDMGAYETLKAKALAKADSLKAAA